MRNSLVLFGLCAAACGKGGGKSAGIELFGNKPVPPGELSKVKADMTQAQFKAAFPKAYKTPNHSGSPSLSIDSGFDNVKYAVVFYDDIDKVAEISVEVPKELGAKLPSAWGAPKDTKGPFGPKWRNDEDGYTAEAMEMGHRTDIMFRPFTPLTADYFGKAPGPFDELAKLKLGMTRDEAKAAAKVDFPPKGGGAYSPTKGKADGVTLEARFDDSTDKLESMSVEMPQKGVDMLAKAWGAPKVGKIRGDNAPCQMWQSADKSMQIEISNPEGRESMMNDGSPSKVVSMTIAAPDHSFCEVAP